NFSKAVKVATENGSALVMKNNKPRYMIIDLNSEGYLSDDVKIEIAAKQILEKYRPAFEELAK
ncbi:MAG: type II toxin-antitoxin system Phd/YefM family antitoxin, partial [Bacillota bacterium]